MKDIIRMNQLAGIITEDQAKKMIATLNESNNKPIMLGVGDQITPDMVRRSIRVEFSYGNCKVF
jgi:dUTPase